MVLTIKQLRIYIIKVDEDNMRSTNTWNPNRHGAVDIRQLPMGCKMAEEFVKVNLVL